MPQRSPTFEQADARYLRRGAVAVHHQTVSGAAVVTVPDAAIAALRLDGPGPATIALDAVRCPIVIVANGCASAALLPAAGVSVPPGEIRFCLAGSNGTWAAF